MKQLLVEKYRPKIFADYVFCTPEHLQKFISYAEQAEIPNLLLSGGPGTGKTTAAKILIELLGIDEADLLEINASDENNVETIREKIINFITTIAMGKFKVVHLGEADYLSIQAQGILRGAMEDFSDNARFILTCNYENRIIPAIKSRCQHFHFKNLPRDAVLERCINILLQEEIEFEPDDVEKLVAIGYPDMRKTINLIQQNTLAGRLVAVGGEGTGESDVKVRLLELLQDKKLREARELVCSSVTTDQIEDIYRFMYLNLDKVFKDINQYEAGIVILAKYLYQHQAVADTEINLAAAFVELSKL